jgi:hypothetical protein
MFQVHLLSLTKAPLCNYLILRSCKIFFGLGASLLILNRNKRYGYINTLKYDNTHWIDSVILYFNGTLHNGCNNITYPLILITKATFGSPSTKKEFLALASLLFLMRAKSAAWYSLKYFSAFYSASFLEAALSFLAYSLDSVSDLRTLASLACFLRMFSGTTLALLIVLKKN